MGNYKYVSKNEVRPYIELFEEVFRKIQKEIKKETGFCLEKILSVISDKNNF